MTTINETTLIIEEIKQDIERIESIFGNIQNNMKRLTHETNLLKVCPFCEKSFRAVGRKKYCSDNCRVRAFLENKMSKESENK